MGSDTPGEFFPWGCGPVGVHGQRPGPRFPGKCFQWDISIPLETVFLDPSVDFISSLKAPGAGE